MNNKCIGCGILLQDVDKDMDGYVSSNDHRLCLRCFKIKNYGQNRVVVANNDDYLKIIDGIDKAKVRLRANVNFDLTVELMFLNIRDNLK